MTGRWRHSNDVRDVDNRDPEAMLSAHEARIAALSQQQRQIGLLEDRVLSLEEEVGVLRAMVMELMEARR